MIDTHEKTRVVFQRELVQDCFCELIPLLAEHGRELEYHRDLLLDPEFSKYELLENSGLLRTYTARDHENKLIGYALFFFSTHLHFKKTIFATCDILYIQPKRRGFGLRFLMWCNDNLRRDGAKRIDYYVNENFDYSPILRRMGFARSALVYSA